MIKKTVINTPAGPTCAEVRTDTVHHISKLYCSFIWVWRSNPTNTDLDDVLRHRESDVTRQKICEAERLHHLYRGSTRNCESHEAYGVYTTHTHTHTHTHAHTHTHTHTVSTLKYTKAAYNQQKAQHNTSCLWWEGLGVCVCMCVCVRALGWRADGSVRGGCVCVCVCVCVCGANTNLCSRLNPWWPIENPEVKMSHPKIHRPTGPQGTDTEQRCPTTTGDETRLTTCDHLWLTPASTQSLGLGL